MSLTGSIDQWSQEPVIELRSRRFTNWDGRGWLVQLAGAILTIEFAGWLGGERQEQDKCIVISEAGDWREVCAFQATEQPHILNL